MSGNHNFSDKERKEERLGMPVQILAHLTEPVMNSSLHHRSTTHGIQRLGLLLWLCAALAPAWAGPPPQAPSPLVLTPGAPCQALGPHMEILVDPAGHLTFAEVTAPSLAGRFRPVAARALNLGITASAYWLRFTVAATVQTTATLETLPADDWLLNLGWPITSVQLFAFPPLGPPNRNDRTPRNALMAGWTTTPAGHLQLLNAPGRFRYDFLVFRLPPRYRTPRTFYLRVESFTSLFLPLEVCSAENYQRHARLRMLGLGFFYGILLAVVLYNLIIFISLKDRAYFWYVCHEAAIGLYFLCFNWIFYQYLCPNHPMAAVRFCSAFLGAALLSAVLFTRSFLRTRNRAPLFDRLLLTLVAASAALLALCPFVPFRLLAQFSAMLGLTAPLLLIGAGVVCLRQGFRSARFFLLAWTVYVLSGVLWALTYRGLLPFSSWNLYSFQIGSALEAVLLSFALADRIKTLRQEREALEFAKIEVDKVNALQSLILNNSMLGIAFVKDQTYEWVNPRQAELLAIPLPQLIGQSKRFLFESEEAFKRFDREVAATLARGEIYEAENQVRRPDGSTFWCRAIAKAADPKDPTKGSVWVVEDTTERKQAEQEREKLIGELHAALAQIKTLHGFLPICAKCKSIRNDQGYWQRLETYIEEHSDAELTHSICPKCARELYPDHCHRFE